MPRHPGLAACLALAACASPSPAFLGAEPRRVEVEGWQIDVYRRGNRAQAIRMTDEWGATAEVMARRGLIAIALVTGCEDLDRSGRPDPAVLIAEIGCG